MLRSILAVLLAAALAAAIAQEPQQAVGPSAAWCKDRTMHPQPGRYRAITIQTGNVDDPQQCIEVLDTQQNPVCRVRYECERAT